MLWQTIRIYPAQAGGDVAIAADVEHQLKADITHLASTIGPRNLQSHPEALRATELWLEEQVRALGFTSRRETIVVDQYDTDNITRHETSNIVVEIPGRSPQTLVLGTHFDSHPHSPGADDNATGVAVLLHFLRYAQHHEFEQTILVYFFTNEEWPYFQTSHMGSRVAARGLVSEGRPVDVAWILDAVGYFSHSPGTQQYPWFLDPFFDNTGDFLLLVGNMNSHKEFMSLRELLLQASGSVKVGGYINAEDGQDMDQSDHASFWREGMRSVLLTDTALFRNPYYHLHNDVAATLDFASLARISEAFRLAVISRAGGTVR